MDEQTLKLYARVFALEYFIAQAFKLIYALGRFSKEDIEKMHQELRDFLPTVRAPTDDPAISDLVSGELEEAHTRILTMIEDAVSDR